MPDLISDFVDVVKRAMGTCVDCKQRCSTCINMNKCWIPDARRVLAKAKKMEKSIKKPDRSRLKKCKKCGCKPVIVDFSADEQGYSIACSCGDCFNTSKTKEEAIEAWNKLQEECNEG